MMNERDTVDFLIKIADIGVDVWLDGGWGVDALIGHQSRPHDDIDVFIKKKDSSRFREMLKSNGFCETEVAFTTDGHTAWNDAEGRTVDLHLFEFAEAGMLCFENELYPSDILNGQGIIGGVAVRCLTAEAQLLYHQGYEHDENDVHDVMLLCDAFGLPIPDEYMEHAEHGDVL